MFVPVPVFPEGLEIWNGCVCSIHGDQGIIENVIGTSILPHNPLALMPICRMSFHPMFHQDHQNLLQALIHAYLCKEA